MTRRYTPLFRRFAPFLDGAERVEDDPTRCLTSRGVGCPPKAAASEKLLPICARRIDQEADIPFSAIYFEQSINALMLFFRRSKNKIRRVKKRVRNSSAAAMPKSRPK